MTAALVRRAECSQCGGLRNCDVRGSYDHRYEEEGSRGLSFWGNTNWLILQCRGCDFTFVQTVSTNSEEYDQWEGDDGSIEAAHTETLKYWPALSKRARPDWLTEYSIEADHAEPLESALREVYGALDNDLWTLAGIGARTCFDVATDLLGVDSSLSFAKKLDAIVAENHIRQVDRQRLKTMVEAGHAAAHRGWKPTPAELGTVMDVLEGFVFDAFVQPHRRKKLDAAAEKVRTGVPPKLPRVKTVCGAGPLPPE